MEQVVENQLGFRSYFADFQVKSFDDEAKVLSFRGTTEDADRSDDVVVADGGDFKNYEKNPLFLWAHDHSGRTLPIGKALSVDKISGIGVDFKIQFDAKDPFAMEVYRKYKEGYLHAVSVGFIANKAERRLAEDGEPIWPPAYKYLEWELLELSGVPIPANPNALRNAYRQFEEYMSFAAEGDQSPEEVMSELLQSSRAKEVKHTVKDECTECPKKDTQIEELTDQLTSKTVEFETADQALKEATEKLVTLETPPEVDEKAEELKAFRTHLSELGITEEEAVALLENKADTQDVDPAEQIAHFIDERLQYLAGKAWK
jgi:HK97 family phage prohead protease